MGEPLGTIFREVGGIMTDQVQETVRRYRTMLGVLFVTVMAVVGLFSLSPSRPLAAGLAGGLFLLVTLGLVVWEYRSARQLTWALGGGLVFLFLGVFPVLGLRVISWGADFKTSTLMGVSGDVLHRASNYFFLIFLIGIFVSMQKVRMKK